MSWEILDPETESIVELYFCAILQGYDDLANEILSYDIIYNCGLGQSFLFSFALNLI